MCIRLRTEKEKRNNFFFWFRVCVSFSSRYFRFCWLCSMITITNETTVVQRTENECFYWINWQTSTNRWRLRNHDYVSVYEKILAQEIIRCFISTIGAHADARTKRKLRITAKKHICMEFCVWRHDTLFTLFTRTRQLTTDCEHWRGTGHVHITLLR